jgi:tetratricopeptide (TPR) repeat protein
MGRKRRKKKRTSRCDRASHSGTVSGVRGRRVASSQVDDRGGDAAALSGSASSLFPDGSRPKRGRFRGWRGWVLRVLLLVLAPLAVLGLLEGGLRLAGYGYPTGFFLESDADGDWVTNHHFGRRFFPPSLVRDPHPCMLSAKPAGSVRIFILGGSAAMGTPDPAFSFGRILEVLLRHRYPGTHIEVVNAAMTAINSHVAFEIARDCAAREPDLFCVYLGNNEVVGPYGPGTVFHRWSPSLPMVRASIWAKSTRTGQLLGDLAGTLGNDEGTPDRWRGMEMFLNNPVPADDPRLAACYDNYRRNLTDICAVARPAGARVVLSTVAVNLRDCPPFASQHRSGLSSADLAKWEALYKAGDEAEEGSRWAEALKKYEAAEEIDGQFAELQFRLGQCLIRVGREAEAPGRFESARDLDVLRFRADSRINEIIREVAGMHASDGVRLADAERALAESNPELRGVPGRELFYEHVHFTFDGNYQLARCFLDEVCAALPQLAALDGRAPVLSRQRCAELLALTLWDEAQLAESMVNMTSKAPFTNQLRHGPRQAAARRHWDELARLAATPENREAAWKTYEAALAKAPGDWTLHQHFGRLAMHSGRPDVATDHLRIAVEKLPRDASIHNNLGNALVDLGQFDEAIRHFRNALELDPADEKAHYNLANVLAGRGRRDEAVAHYREALGIKPGYGAAHFNLGNVLVGSGQVDEGIDHYRKALEINPGDAEAHSNLGAVLAGLGRIDEAVVHFQKALEIKPGDTSIRRNLDLARSQQSQGTDEGGQTRE